MPTFRFHPTKKSLRVDDVDAARLGKNLSAFVRQLADDPTASHLSWPVDKWRDQAIRLLGGNSMHAAQTSAMRDRSDLERLAPADREAARRRLLRREDLSGPYSNTRRGVHIDSLMSADFRQRFPERWRELAIEEFDPFENLRRWTAHVAKVSLLVGDGSRDIAEIVATLRGDQGHLIDVRQPDVHERLAELERNDLGFASTTVCFVGLDAATPAHALAETLPRLVQFARTMYRCQHIFALERRALARHFEAPRVAEVSFDEVRTYALDKLFDDMIWWTDHKLTAPTVPAAA